MLSDWKVIQEKAENKLKYRNFNIGIQQLWNMKCLRRPVDNGVTGNIIDGF
jgi:hypothetical protein